jgi:Tol biopolymer transport system component
LVRRCLEKQPHERFRNARDLAFALDSAVVESSTSQPSIAVADEENRSRAIVGLRPVLAAVALLAAFAAGWWLRPVPAERTPVRITELTFTGADFQPDVSPDNRLIAFTSSRTGVSQIWLRQVEGGGEQPITEGPDARPRFSPDGEAVAFIRKEGDGYSAYRVPVLGGQPRKMVEDVYAVAWSPDRRSLAFLRTGADARQRSGTILGILDLQSGEERVLLQLDGWGLYSPSWSPDSRRIAVTRVGTQGGTGNWLQLVVNALDGMVREVRSDREIVSAATWVGNDALIFAKMMR